MQGLFHQGARPDAVGRAARGYRNLDPAKVRTVNGEATGPAIDDPAEALRASLVN